MPRMNLGAAFGLLLLANFGSTQESCTNPNEFLCSNGDCILKKELCNGERNCYDGSDETRDLCLFRGCSESLDYQELDPISLVQITSVRSSHSFKCLYGACISSLFICDGIRHCAADGSDESKELCANHTCSSKQFKCNYGGCISKRNACDSRYQCHDRSDETEETCRLRRRFCQESTRFKCHYGACIPKRRKCDGVIHCLDGSDESEATCGARPGLEIKSSFPDSTKLIGSETEVTPVKEPPKPDDKPVITIDENRSGCVSDLSYPLEILQCGQSSDCSGTTFPVGTLMLISCSASPIPLKCENDKLWHLQLGTADPPRVLPCDDSGAVVNPPSVPTGESGPKAKIPDECGDLPMFQAPPWLVGLFRNGQFACTGTIIAPTLVLTAGHCVTSPTTSTNKMDAKDLKIQYNCKSPSDPSAFASVTFIEIHKKYTGGTTPHFDMALLFLKDELSSSACLYEGVKLLNIPAWTFNRTVGQSTYGWEAFPQTFNPQCFNRATKCTRHLNIGDNQFCSVNHESNLHLHQGSSGGPYFISRQENGKQKWTLAGVVSSKIETSDCGTPHTVFTSVAKMLPWIQNCGFRGNCQV